MSRDIWDPSAYARYTDERSRPFFELTARIGAQGPATVVDAGCGSGELTAALKRRWPEADVRGFDSSQKMIDQAREHHGVRFDVADAATWTPDGPVDVLVSNALLQWVPTHREVLTRWADALAPEGWLAFQVPGNFDAPSHVIIRELCQGPEWRDKVGDVPRARPVDEPEGYLDLLAGRFKLIDAWETAYVHLLQGEDAVLRWTSGTALRPVFDRLDQEERERFTAQLAVRLGEAYPRRPYGTAFPFRRIFVVGQK
ncbi:trans-aconitate 2-methyltransferase [Nonomuraea soli]|uniref:Trans-aconitate 2-methyltransferase n=1 Tax=Nonomuraea soli TaxID=1032476 RepID=A0A7W0HTW7_9ACTN|nr:trans-aconitate 2-methyltransferase [Nonomuraea soli]MBA2895539.1 trans-aconitate 2-methyltransferase [Nonomuraea soli]